MKIDTDSKIIETNCILIKTWAQNTNHQHGHIIREKLVFHVFGGLLSNRWWSGVFGSTPSHRKVKGQKSQTDTEKEENSAAAFDCGSSCSSLPAFSSAFFPLIFLLFTILVVLCFAIEDNYCLHCLHHEAADCVCTCVCPNGSSQS